MLMTREDRVGKGYCPGCNFEVSGDFHVDASSYFASGYVVLCEFCEEFDEFTFDMRTIHAHAERAIKAVCREEIPEILPSIDAATPDELRALLTGSPWKEDG